MSAPYSVTHDLGNTNHLSAGTKMTKQEDTRDCTTYEEVAAYLIEKFANTLVLPKWKANNR
ncbi:hypothetical protein ACW4E8_09060 [Cupriavidus sp. CP313]